LVAADDRRDVAGRVVSGVRRAAEPRDLVARLNAEINRALLLPEVRDKMAGIGVEVANETPEAFAAALRADTEKWGKAIRELGISMSDA